MAFRTISVCLYLISVIVVCFSSHSRRKRFIQINPDAPMILGLLWNAPVALILPTLVPKDGDKFDHLFRSDIVASEEENSASNHLNETVFGASKAFAETPSFRNYDQDFENTENLLVDPAYTKQTDKLKMIFSVLQVPYMECQERIVCEMAFDTAAYSPVSNYMLRELRLGHGPILHGKTSLMWRYREAAGNGIASDSAGKCGKIYKMCPLPTYRIINMSVLKVLQYFTKVLNMRVV